MLENGWKHNEEMYTENKTLFVCQAQLTAGYAMATDEYLLQAVSSGISQAAVHVYTWEAPCITLGRFTPADTINRSKCNNIEVTRRITGGNALYHKDDVAYAVVMPLGENKNQGLSLCRHISNIIQAVLLEFGIPTVLNEQEHKLNNRRLPCHETTSRCELLYPNGHKAAAAAQKNNRIAILQQGSIYLNHHPEEISQYLAATTQPLNDCTSKNCNIAKKEDFLQKFSLSLAEEFQIPPKKILLPEKSIDTLFHKKYRTTEWIWQNFN